MIDKLEHAAREARLAVAGEYRDLRVRIERDISIRILHPPAPMSRHADQPRLPWSLQFEAAGFETGRPFHFTQSQRRICFTVPSSR